MAGVVVGVRACRIGAEGESGEDDYLEKRSVTYRVQKQSGAAIRERTMLGNCISADLTKVVAWVLVEGCVQVRFVKVDEGSLMGQRLLAAVQCPLYSVLASW